MAAPPVAPARPPRVGRRGGLRLDRPVVSALLLVFMVCVFVVATLQVHAYQGAVTRDDFTISGQFPVPATRFTPTGSHLNVVAVVAHGFGGSKASVAALGVELARAGITAYTFDFPGHGLSQVPFAADGHTEYDSAVAAASTQLETAVDEVVQYAMGHSSAPDSRVILVGDSMGTGVVGDYALHHAASASLAAVVLISPVWAGMPDPATFPSLLAIAGTNDLAVSLHHEGRLMQAMCGRPLSPATNVGTCSTNGTAREFRILPNLDHISIVTATQSITAVLDFLRRNVATAMPVTAVQADDQVHWLILGVLAAALATIPLLAIAVSLLRLPAGTSSGTRSGRALTTKQLIAGEGILLAATAAALLVQHFAVPLPLAFLGQLTAPDVVTILAVAGIAWLALLLVFLPSSARQVVATSRPTWPRQVILALVVFAFLYATLGQLATYAYTEIDLTPAKMWRFAAIAALLLPFFFAGEWLHGAYATASPRLAVALGVLPKVVLIIALASIVGALLGFVIALFAYVLGLEAWARRAMRAPFVPVPLIGALLVAWAIASVYPFVT